MASKQLDFDPYAELGVEPDAELSEIKRAWRDVARKHHPDTASQETGGKPDAARFQRCKEAYEILSDPERRRNYDETGEADMESPDNADASVFSYLIDAFMEVFGDYATEPGDIMLIGGMKKYLRARLTHWADQIEGAELMIERCEAVLKRLRYTGSGRDVIGRKLRVQKEGSEGVVRKAREEIEHINRAIERTADYVYRRDEQDDLWGPDEEPAGFIAETMRSLGFRGEERATRSNR